MSARVIQAQASRKARTASAVGAALMSLMLVASLAPGGARAATLIDFEDLVYIPNDDEPYELYTTPVTNEYASLGVVFSRFYLGEGLRSYQGLRGDQRSSITFTGTAPTFVSMAMGWLPEDILDIRAVGPGGWSASFRKCGYCERPDPPRDFGSEVVSFYAPGGITSVSFADSQFMRFPMKLDSLHFGQGPVPAVPEPASATFLGAGLLLVLALQRRAARLRRAENAP